MLVGDLRLLLTALQLLLLGGLVGRAGRAGLLQAVDLRLHALLGLLLLTPGGACVALVLPDALGEGADDPEGCTDGLADAGEDDADACDDPDGCAPDEDPGLGCWEQFSATTICLARFSDSWAWSVWPPSRCMSPSASHDHARLSPTMHLSAGGASVRAFEKSVPAATKSPSR